MQLILNFYTQKQSHNAAFNELLVRCLEKQLVSRPVIFAHIVARGLIKKTRMWLNNFFNATEQGYFRFYQQ